MPKRAVSSITSGRSTVYVYGELDPPELALFAAQELRVRPTDARSARIEAIGHAIGYWVAGRATSRAFGAFQEGQRIMELTLAAYTLLGGDPFRVRASGWVEARGVTSGANVMGFVSPRFRRTTMWPPDDARNAALAEAVFIAGIVHRKPLQRLALRDLHAAYLDTGTDAFVFGYRAVEDIRHTVKMGDASSAVWKQMHQRLGTSARPTIELAKISTLVRHGQASDPNVRAAARPRRRAELLSYARDVVRAEVVRLIGRPLTTL
jgi:hypothetical protein